MLKTLLRGIAMIVLALFTVLFPVSLIVHDVGALIFNPSTTKTLVRENLLDAKFIATISRQAISEMLAGESGLEGGATESGDLRSTVFAATFGQLSDEDWQTITNLTAPTALMDQTTASFIDAYTLWLDSDKPFPPLNLDLKVWKENAHNNAPEIMRVLLDAMPGCTSEQTSAIGNENLQTGEGVLAGFKACRPPEPFYSLMILGSPLVFEELLRGAPDVVDIDLITQGSDVPNELTQFKTGLVQVRTVVNWGWVIVAGVGLLAAVAGSRGWNSFLRWAGWPVLFSGVFIVLFGLGLQFFSLNFLDALIGGPLAQRGGAVGALGSAIAGGAMDLVNRSLLIEGVVLSGLGTASVYLASFLGRRATATGIPLNKRRIGL